MTIGDVRNNVKCLLKDVARLNEVPVNGKVVFFGDSLLAQTTGGTGNQIAFQSTALMTYALLKANNAVFLPVGGNLGISGNTTTQMLARLGAAVAQKPDLVVLLGGTNDVNDGTPAATIIKNLTLIHRAFRGTQAKVLWITIPKRFAPAALDDAKETVRKTVNVFIRKQDDGITRVVDLEKINLTSASFADGLHFNPTGAYAAGMEAYKQLKYFVNEVNIAETLAPDTTYTANPIMAGTAGTKNTATGTVATSWALDSSAAGGATVVGSKTVQDGLDQQLIVVSGNYTGTGRNISLSQEFATGSLVAGNVVEGFADVEILTTDGNVLDFNVGALVWTSAYANLAGAESILALDAVPSPIQPGRWIFRTPPITIGAGTPAIVRTGFKIDLVTRAGATPIAVSFKINRMGVRKV